MKHSIDDASFRPVTLSLTLESQEEVDALFALFNHVVLYDYLNSFGMNIDEVRDSLPQHQYRVPFEQLDKAIKKHK